MALEQSEHKGKTAGDFLGKYVQFAYSSRARVANRSDIATVMARGLACRVLMGTIQTNPQLVVSGDDEDDVDECMDTLPQYLHAQNTTENEGKYLLLAAQHSAPTQPQVCAASNHDGEPPGARCRVADRCPRARTLSRLARTPRALASTTTQ